MVQITTTDQYKVIFWSIDRRHFHWYSRPPNQDFKVTIFWM